MKIIKIVFVFFVAFYAFVATDVLAQDAPAPIVAPTPAPAELTFKENVDRAELEKFMEVWPRFMKWAYENNDPIIRVDNAFSKDKNLDYSTGLVKWLGENNMQVDRFFYIENRAKELIHALQAYDKAMKGERLISQMSGGEVSSERITELQNEYIPQISVEEKILFQEKAQALTDMFASVYQE